MRVLLLAAAVCGCRARTLTPPGQGDVTLMNNISSDLFWDLDGRHQPDVLDQTAVGGMPMPAKVALFPANEPQPSPVSGIQPSPGLLAPPPPPTDKAHPVMELEEMVVVPEGLTKEAALAALKQPPSARPVALTTEVVLQNLQAIDQKAGTFQLQGNLVLNWTDPRVALPKGVDRAVLDIDLKDETGALWNPTLEWYNGLKVDEHVKLALLPGSQLVYTHHFYGVFSVRLDFFYFPLDIQVLPVFVDLYLDPATIASFTPATVIQRGGVENPLWTVQGTEVTHMPVERVTGFRFDRLKLYIYCSRRHSKYAFSMLLPQLTLLLLSYGAYFMDPKVAPARTALVMITLLSSMGYASATQAELPATGTMIWIDAINATCIFSAGIAVWVTVVVFWLLRKDAFGFVGVATMQTEAKMAEDADAPIIEATTKWPRHKKAERIDLVMRWAWPIYTFFHLLFILVVWPAVRGGFLVPDYAKFDFD